MELPHTPPRVQRDAEPVLALEHQPMKARGVDPGFGIARRQLSGRDVGRRIDFEVQGNWEFREVDVVCFDGDVMPFGPVHQLDRRVAGTALAERRRQVERRDSQRESEHLAVSGDVGDHRHRIAFDVLEYDHRASAKALELVDKGGDIETSPHRFSNAQQLLGEFPPPAAPEIRAGLACPSPTSSPRLRTLQNCFEKIMRRIEQ